MSTGRKFAYRIWVPDSDGELQEFKAGDSVPAWVVKAIDNPKAFTDGDDDGEDTPEEPEEPQTAAEPDTEEPEDEVEVPDYEALTIPALKAEIDKRNEGRAAEDEVVVEGAGNKPDLVAALVADDAAQSASDD